MSSTPSLSDLASQRDEGAQYYHGILHELVEMASDIARAVHRQATTEQSAEPAPAKAPASDPTIAFERIARTIHRTILLARTLTDPAQPSPAAQARQRRLAARKQTIREVNDTIEREADGSPPGHTRAVHPCRRAEHNPAQDTPALDRGPAPDPRTTPHARPGTGPPRP